LWDFLNSSLGLWILSSVFLGGLTFLYSAVSTASKMESERIERLSGVESELELRFAPIMAKIAELRDRRSGAASTAKAHQTELQMAQAKIGSPVSNLVTLDFSRDKLTAEEVRPLFFTPGKDEPFHVEYVRHTVSSLFAEGHRLSRDPKEKAAIKAALQCLEEARNYLRDSSMFERGELPTSVGGNLTTVDDTSSEERQTLKAEMMMTAESFHRSRYRTDYEDQIVMAWDYWQKRSVLKQSELRTSGNSTVGGDARISISEKGPANRTAEPDRPANAP